MKITKVSYRTNVLVEQPNGAPTYRSKHVEVEATVGDGESPEVVLLALAEWAHEQLGLSRPTPPPKPALRTLGDET